MKYCIDKNDINKKLNYKIIDYDKIKYVKWYNINL